jgi:hypothetical protein
MKMAFLAARNSDSMGRLSTLELLLSFSISKIGLAYIE